MKINKLITPYNFTDKNDPERIKYIVIHYVGALGGAEANCKYYASQYIGASAHYYCGFDGEIWQSVEDSDIAWHCGASSYKHPECRNSNSIGIELCVRNKGNMSADSKDWYFEDKTVEAAIELTKELMKKYNIPVDRVIRHHDITGKICPNPFVYNTTKHKWEDFKKSISSQTSETTKMTKITGKAVAIVEKMKAYIQVKNSNIDSKVLDLIPVYLKEGEIENIRGDIAFAQSCLETGNFSFCDSEVTLDQNNFAGIGVTKKGEKGHSFSDPEVGVRAQIQHLKAYANTAALKEECVDPRFSLVSRGCAPYVEHLGIQENPKGKGWASGEKYGEKILNILDSILKEDDTQAQDQSSYIITTTCDVLNIRKGAGTQYPVVGIISENIGSKKRYTIVEVKNSWGRLLSGAGWINLNYTQQEGEIVKDSYTITTTCDVLNIRKGAGTQYPVVGTIAERSGKKNKYTIVEEKKEWGKLLSGAGWINLNHVQR